LVYMLFFFFSSRRRHTRLQGDWSSDVCSSDLMQKGAAPVLVALGAAEPIDQAVSRWRRSLGGDEAARTAAGRLRRLVWLPIEKRSEERRVGKECRSRGRPEQYRKRRVRRAMMR